MKDGARDDLQKNISSNLAVGEHMLPPRIG